MQSRVGIRKYSVFLAALSRMVLWVEHNRRISVTFWRINKETSFNRGR